MPEAPVRPAITVAAVVERDGRYLVVEEETRAGRRLNQPAGHLESGESLVAGTMRETLEETGWRVAPTHLIGIYTWSPSDNGATFVRFAFAASAQAHDAHRPLDDGIVQALWLTYDELVSRRSEHRSPLVLRCVDDFRAGRNWPAELITEM
ncbi:MAG TPA: NUDIX hydrolase [Casimicrobiaceae bacterium]|jgi:8-oxo-dGTP pyrophosphatase MutT (NUDIX family)